MPAGLFHSKMYILLKQIGTVTAANSGLTNLAVLWRLCKLLVLVLCLEATLQKKKNRKQFYPNMDFKTSVLSWRAHSVEIHIKLILWTNILGKLGVTWLLYLPPGFDLEEAK